MNPSSNAKQMNSTEAAYIPLGKVHCLASPGDVPLAPSENQTGSYLGKNYIIRIVDEFGRSCPIGLELIKPAL